ncbi:MAG TPA: hypothetical protein VLE22_03880 [Bryobacteraceae bacterium]|nr:hypothetical protein [Bryobacteraceae bacterium]
MSYKRCTSAAVWIAGLLAEAAAAAVILGILSTAQAAVPYPPPTTWKGVNYSPRRHTYFRMLYDWYSWDSTAGKYVHQMVDADLTRLSQNGYNLLHLYLWDQELLRSVNAAEPAGFLSAPSDPSGSPNNQWGALNDFVTKAESKGLFVALHFASGRFIHRMQGNPGGTPDQVATEFANWTEKFIRYLNSTNPHNNVLLWGLAYSIAPVPGDTTGDWSTTWKLAYKKVDDYARMYSPHPSVLGLIGTNLYMDQLRPDGQPWDGFIYPRSQGYTWNWQEAQRMAKTMRDLLTSAYGTQKDPDIYMMQLYHPNSYDLLLHLSSLSSGYVANGIPAPVAKIFVVEFATSSSLNSPPNGNNIPYYGDAQTPTTTVSGHSQWLNNTLCAYRSAGLQKYAYWSMFDPYTMWTGSPWYVTGQDLAWSGFWGLSFEPEASGDKPSWSLLSSFYLNGSINCPSPGQSNAPAVVSLTSSSNYYTVAQPVRLTWTAADVASFSLNRGHGASYSCSPEQTGQVSSDVAGSCAYTDASAFSSTGSQTVTLTGYNVWGSPQNASASVTIGLGPIVNAATDQNYTYTINAYDTIIVWGNGFSLTGGNTIQLTRAGYPDVWMYNGDGHYFWDHSHFQINASLDGRAATGQWTLYVRNGYSGTPSAAYTIMINP